MSGRTVRDEIVVLEHDDDEYFEHDILSLDYMKGIVPALGDRIAFHLEEGEAIAIYCVEERFLVDPLYVDETKNDESFWVLIVRQIEEDRFRSLGRILSGLHKYGFGNTWRGEPYPEIGSSVEIVPPGETVADLDRSNRDPEYWTFERKELLRQEREARLAAMKAEDTKKAR